MINGPVCVEFTALADYLKHAVIIGLQRCVRADMLFQHWPDYRSRCIFHRESGIATTLNHAKDKSFQLSGRKDGPCAAS